MDGSPCTDSDADSPNQNRAHHPHIVQVGTVQPQHSTPIKAQLSFTHQQYGNQGQHTHFQSPVINVKQSTDLPPSQNQLFSPAMSSIKFDSPSKGFSPGHQSSFSSDMDTGTIQRQRHELQLMMIELKDRDKELNEMAAAHQKEILAWEQDRQRLLTLEQKCVKLARELKKKSDELAHSETRFRVLLSEDKSRTKALETTQEQLVRLNQEQAKAALKLQDLGERNKSLSMSVRDFSTKVGEMEAKEHELMAQLQNKDKDVAESHKQLSDLRKKLKSMDQLVRDSNKSELEAKRQASDMLQKYNALLKKMDVLKGEVAELDQDFNSSTAELNQSKKEVADLKQEIQMLEEREKRKDQLLELQKSKQERTDAELTHLRQLYERQQRDLSLLHLNLESTKELLNKHSTGYSDIDTVMLSESTVSMRYETPASSPVKSVKYADSHQSHRKSPKAWVEKSPSSNLETSTGKISSKRHVSFDHLTGKMYIEDGERRASSATSFKNTSPSSREEVERQNEQSDHSGASPSFQGKSKSDNCKATHTRGGSRGEISKNDSHNESGRSPTACGSSETFATCFTSAAQGGQSRGDAHSHSDSRVNRSLKQARTPDLRTKSASSNLSDIQPLGMHLGKIERDKILQIPFEGVSPEEIYPDDMKNESQNARNRSQESLVSPQESLEKTPPRKSTQHSSKIPSQRHLSLDFSSLSVDSPTTKLQKLLTESKQMVQELEKATSAAYQKMDEDSGHSEAT